MSRTPPSAPSADLAARTSPLWPRSPSCIAGPTCASPPTTTLRGGADGHAPPRRAGADTLRLGPPAKYPRQPCSRLPSVGDRTVVASVVIAPSPPLAGEPRCPTRFQPSVRSSTPAQAARLPPCVQIRSGNASSSSPHCFACLVTTTTGPPGAAVAQRLSKHPCDPRTRRGSLHTDRKTMQVAIATGASSGIGASAVMQIAKRGSGCS